MVQYQKNNDALGTVNRGNPAESGLCTLCSASCEGRCETWMSSMIGRKMLSIPGIMELPHLVDQA